MGNELAKLFVVIGADTKGLSKELRNVHKQVMNYSKVIATAGAAMATAAAANLKNWAATGAEIDNLSRKLSFSAQAVSGWKYALEQSGSSISVIESATGNLSKVLYQAADGSDSASKALNEIGLSVSQLIGLSPEEKFNKVALALAEVDSQTRQAALAQQIFGKSGMDLIPLLEQGADGIAKMRDEAATFTDEQARAAARLDDSISRMGQSLDQIRFQLAEDMAPAAETFLTVVERIIKKIGDWSEKNKELSATAAGIGGGVASMAAGAYIGGKIGGPLGAAAGAGIGGILYGFGYNEGLKETREAIIDNEKEMEREREKFNKQEKNNLLEVLERRRQLIDSYNRLNGAESSMDEAMNTHRAAIDSAIISIQNYEQAQRNHEAAVADAAQVENTLKEAALEAEKARAEEMAKLVEQCIASAQRIRQAEWQSQESWFQRRNSEIDKNIRLLEGTGSDTSNWRAIQENLIRQYIDPGIRGQLLEDARRDALESAGTSISSLPSVSLPSFAEGGIVPGPVGEPVPVIAHGGEAFLGVGNRAGGNTYVVHVHTNNLISSKMELVREVRDGLMKIARENVVSGV